MHFSSLLLLFVGGEIVDLVLQTGPVAKTVLVLLLVFSVLSWAVILSKWRLIRRARGQSGRRLSLAPLLPGRWPLERKGEETNVPPEAPPCSRRKCQGRCRARSEERRVKKE